MQKQISKLLPILLAVCMLFVGCDKQDIDVSEYSEGFSETSFGDDSLATSEESLAVDDVFKADKSKILEVISKDTVLTRLLIGGGILNGLETAYDYVPLPEKDKYHSFDEIEKLISEIYSKDSDAGERYLTYPTAAGPTVKNIGGVTNVCSAYLPEITVLPDVSAAEFISCSHTEATVSVPCSDGREYVFNAVLEDGDWHIDSSLFFMTLDLPDTGSWLESGLVHGQNEGSAKSLNGNCLVVNVFIDDAVSSWSQSDVKKVLGYMNDSAYFLENEAARYGSELKLFLTDDITSVYIKTSKNITTSLDDYLWIELLFADTTYRTLEGCVKSYFNLESYDNWCVMLHVSKKGRSYALCCNSDFYDYRIYYSERAVMYFTNDTTYAYYSVASDYAHEMLHLFGAVDLYNDHITASSAELLDHFYPNAIMRVTPDDIGMAAVSPYTAYRIGWISEIPDIYKGIKLAN